MSNIHYIEPRNEVSNLKLLTNIFRLRNDSFKIRLGWDVNCINGLETDAFDELNVSHIAMTDNKKNILGCWRALPTQGDYMLRSVFPELLRGEPLPEKSNIWEISRFTIKKNSISDRKTLISNSTAYLVKSFYDFAQHKGIKSYVLVTTVACERILRCLGVKARRMGDGKSTQVGIEKSVALWIDVDDSLNLSVN